MFATNKKPHTYFIGLSIFRLTFGAYLLADLIFLFPHITAFFSEQGLLPQALISSTNRSSGMFSLLFLSTSDTWLNIVFALYATLILAFITGYRTRTVTALLFIVYMSIYWRNTLINSGIETLTSAFLLWANFVPLSRYFSFDAALDNAPPSRPHPKLPIHIFSLQVSLMYFYAAWYKLAGATWVNGTALNFILNDNEWAGYPWSIWLAQHGGILLPLATWGIIIFQFSFIFLMHSPWYNNITRSLAIFGAFITHLGFLIFLDVGMFPILCFSYLPILIPDAWWQKLFQSRAQRLSRVAIFYEPGCNFCHRIARIFKTFCLPAATPVQSASVNPTILQTLKKHNSWVVIDETGHQRLGWNATAYILRQSPVLAPLGWLYLIKILQPGFESLYRLIGRSRSSLGRFVAWLFPFRTVPVLPQVAVIFCIFLFALGNISLIVHLPPPAFRSEQAQAIISQIWPHPPLPTLKKLAQIFQVSPRWSLFAPQTNYGRVTLRLLGEKPNGQIVNLATPEYWPMFHQNAEISKLSHPLHRWKKYFVRTTDSSRGRAKLRKTMLNYLCRQLNPPSQPPRITKVTYQFVRHETNVQGPTGRVSYQLTQSQNCQNIPPSPYLPARMRNQNEKLE